KPFQSITSVRLPADRLHEGVAVEALSRVIGYSGGHQYLSQAGQTGNAGSQIDGEPFDTRMRAITVRVGSFPRLAHVQTDTHAREIGLVVVHRLESQREQDCGTGRLTGQKAAVTRPVDNASARLRHQLLHMRPVPSDQLADGLIPPSRLQRGG